MTTVEKLFVQIFERKNWIIEQAKQQADLYNQNLASKLLIDGIAPPSWLWNPNFDSQSSDPKELNKEELISKLLLPHPRPTFPYSSSYCSLYSKPAVTGDNGDSSDGSFMETRASEKYTDAGDGSKAVPKWYVNDTESSLNCVPELDFRVTSPQDQADGLFMETHASDKCIDAGNGLTTVPECCDNAAERALYRARVLDLNATSPQAQTDVRISNYYAVPDQSLARIQRSKSRQTALKLRNSAKATSKRRLSNENNPGLSSSGIRTDTQTVDHANVLFELIKPSDVNRESRVLREEKEGNQSKENGTSSYFGRITRSRSFCKQHSGVNESLKAEKSVQIENIDGGLLPESEEDLQHPNHVNGSLGPVTESCIGRDSTENPGALNEFPKLDGPCYSGKVSSPMCAQSIGKSMQQLDDANELLEFVKSSSEQIGRKTRSRTACSNEGISKACSGVRIQPIDELVQQLDDANELPEFIKSSSEFVGRKTRSQTARSNEGIPKASGGMCTQSIGNLKEQLNDVNELAEVVKPSSKFTGRKTRSQTAYINEGISKPVNSSSIPGTTDSRSRADATKTFHLANLSDNKVIPVCPGTDAVNQEENNSTVLAIELVPYGPVEAQPLCSGSNVDGVNLRVGSEGLVSRLPSGSFMAVKPKQLDFYGMEENNLGNTSSPPFEKKRTDKSSDQICCTSSEPASSVDKETPHSSNKDILEQQSPIEQEMSPKEKEAWRRSNVGTVEKFVGDKRKKFGSNISQMMENIEGNSEVILPIQNSTVLHGEDVVQSVHKSSDVGMDQVRCQSSKGYQSSLDPQAEEGGLGYEGRDKRETGSGEAGLFYGSVGATHGEDGILGHLKPRSLQLANESSLAEMRSSSAKVDSWPQFKRRKVEDHLADSFSASPSFRAQKLHTSQGGPRRRCLKTAENNSDAVLQYQALPFSQERDASPSNANMSFDVGIYQQTKCDSPNGIESSTMLQKEQVELGSEERDDDAEIPSTYKHKQMGPSLVPSLTKQAAQDFQGCSGEDVEIVDPTSHILDARYKHLLHLENKVNGLNADDLTGNETTLLERKSCLIEEGLLSHNSIGSQHNGGLNLNGSELEAFILDAQTENGGVDVAENGSLFATTERASVVEEICRSAGINTPFSHFSSKFNPRSTDYLYKSVPNGLLDRVDLQNPLLGDEAFKHFRAIYSGTDENTAFTKASYSDCLPYSPARFGWNSKNLYSSPVGKLWERISSGSGSSEKRISFNPELTCFTIEEDPGIIEENENADEVAHKIQEGGPTETSEREPLSEITEACLYPSAPLSVEEKFQDRGSLDSISTEVSLAGTHNRAKRKLRNYSRDKGSTNETMEKQSFLVGRNGIRKVNKSLNNRFTKPKLSGKTSLKKGEQRFSEKVPTRNNIVSNITSFVPLVQQKQAAAVCTGKRDVKVRALEAAEAAKRLEEKRQTERKMKKEAMKVERVRIGQENLRQRELDKKKKEEEQKKKDADKAARKRLREEEEKKEKGRKRNRIEEARRQVKMQEEKLHAGEVEKENQCNKKDDKVKSGKESENQIGKSQQMDGGDKILEKPETEVMTAGISTSDIREAGDLYSDIDNRKVLGTLDKSGETDDLGSKKSPEKSYEISPYQCSDDEEDEEDDIRTKKFIPSWASKNCVALVLSSQREIDPDIIFPRESFCSMDEVLVPRKLQPK